MDALNALAEAQADLVVPRLLEMSAAGATGEEIGAVMDQYYEGMGAALALIFGPEGAREMIRTMGEAVNSELVRRLGVS